MGWDGMGFEERKERKEQKRMFCLFEIPLIQY